MEDTFKKEKFVLSVAQSPDGRWLASGSMDGTVAVFDAATGQLLHTLDGHFKPVRSLCFTPGACLAEYHHVWRVYSHVPWRRSLHERAGRADHLMPPVTS